MTGRSPPADRPEPTAETACYCPAMVTVPLDEGPRDRRRVGPFWLEEGTWMILLGGFLLAAVLGLYVVAVLFDRA